VSPRYPFQPDYSLPPGETLRSRIEAIDLSQAELAMRSGLSTKHVNQIIKGLAPITHETALTLERVTGTPASIWNKLEARYRENLLRRVDVSQEDRSWLGRLPLKELRRRHLITTSTDITELFNGVLTFFGVADRPAWENLWLKPSRSFRRATTFETSPEAVATWVRIGELEAREIDTQPYDVATFRIALQEIRSQTRQPDFDHVVQLCADAGVGLVFVPEVEKCRISGAAWWASSTRAVIALSDRYKANDRFWFTLFHESGHLLLHSKKETFVDYDGDDGDLESEADRFASDLLIPPDAARRLPELSTERDVKRFAEEIGIADGIVVGRLQYLRLWDWSKGNGLKRRVRIVSALKE
jgi:HTH-type transcriptional regulator/antitoxin HigA